MEKYCFFLRPLGTLLDLMLSCNFRPVWAYIFTLQQLCSVHGDDVAIFRDSGGTPFAEGWYNSRAARMPSRFVVADVTSATTFKTTLLSILAKSRSEPYFVLAAASVLLLLLYKLVVQLGARSVVKFQNRQPKRFAATQKPHRQ